MLARHLTLPSHRAVAVKLPARLGRRGAVRVRCDDEEMIPLTKVKHGFTDRELEKLAHPKLLGGKTVGDELALIRKAYLKAEAKAIEGEQRLVSANWDGDVYVGSKWNTLSVLYLFFLLTPLAGLVFAWATYGTLWATGAYY